MEEIYHHARLRMDASLDAGRENNGSVEELSAFFRHRPEGIVGTQALAQNNHSRVGILCSQFLRQASQVVFALREVHLIVAAEFRVIGLPAPEATQIASVEFEPF